jgi:hypothetical protein
VFHEMDVATYYEVMAELGKKMERDARRVF